MTNYRLASASVSVMLAVLFSMPGAQAKKDVATVHVELVDTFSGEDLIGPVTVESFTPESGVTPESADPSRNLAKQFREGAGSDIPFGVYRLRARATGYYS